MEQGLFSSCPLLSLWEHFLPLWNQNFHYRYKNQLIIRPILSRLNPFHNSTPNFAKIHFNIILQSEPIGTRDPFISLLDSNSICIAYLPRAYYIPSLFHSL